eukprot:1619872-Amphidinium_carterae.1
MRLLSAGHSKPTTNDDISLCSSAGLFRITLLVLSSWVATATVESVIPWVGRAWICATQLLNV